MSVAQCFTDFYAHPLYFQRSKSIIFLNEALLRVKFRLKGLGWDFLESDVCCSEPAPGEVSKDYAGP